MIVKRHSDGLAAIRPPVLTRAARIALEVHLGPHRIRSYQTPLVVEDALQRSPLVLTRDSETVTERKGRA